MMKPIPVVVCLVLMTACGKKEGPNPPAASDGSDRPTVAPAPAPEPPASPVKPPPPPEVMKGSVRLVNLLVAEDGKTQRVDVWAVGGMYAPVELAAGLDFGKASDWFATPLGAGMRVVAVPEGAAGEDASKLAALSNGREGENLTSLLLRDAEGRVTSVTNAGADDVARPAAGKGLVLLHAGQLMPYEASLQASVGGRSFMVGEPGGTCGTTVLGGTNYTLHEVAPGRARFTLHKWPGDCTTPAVLEIDVDVNADKGVRVELFTRDGSRLETALMPLTMK